MTWSIRRVLRAVAAVGVLGCSGSDGSNGPTPSIQVSATPSSLTLQQGSSGTVALALVRGGGFSAAVNLSVDGLPSGVTTSITPSQLTGATTSATVTVTVAASVAPGAYTATVRASATGVGEATATYSLTVTGLPNYTLSATPAAVSIPQGTTGTSTIGIARTNFTGAVTLTLDNPPAGITGSFNPTPASGDNSQLTISVASTVATGTHTLTVKGSATGPGDKTTTIALTVTPPPNYALSATPAAVTVTQGGTGTTTIGIARTSFTGGVALTLDSPPAGITGAFNPTPATGDNSVLTISVATSVATGNYTLTVKGSATGPGDKTTTVALTVTQAPDYSLTTTPGTLTINAGANQTTTVNIARTNFTGAVTLALDAPPAGITATFNPAAPTGASSVATISVAASVAPQNYTLTIKGTATGVPEAVPGAATFAAGDRTTTVALTVLPVPDYAIAASPNAITVLAGVSGTTTVNLTRTNFTGDVALSLVTPPAGITGIFTPATLTGAGTSSSLVISVASSVAAGVYPVTIKGSATGAGDKTTVVTVTVPASDYLIAASPNALTILAGTSGNTTVNITRSNFTGDIALSLQTPPTGITGVFTPATANGNSSALVISVAGSVAPAVYPVTIKGSATGPGDKTTVVTVTVTAPDYSLSASPNALTIVAGSSGNTTVNITRSNFTGDIALSLQSPPTGITGVFTPATANGTSSALVISVAGSVAPGTYPVTIKGSATGPGDKTTVVTVTVPAPGVTLSTNPSSISVEQGASGTSTLTATRVNYTGTITPSYTGNPGGMSLTFNPNPLTGNTSTITVSVGGSVAVGQYTVTITGASGLAGNPTTQLVVSVTQQTGSSMEWQFCTAEAPLKFWRKSGTTWSEVAPTVMGNITKFAFTISSATGGVAYTLQSGSASFSPLLSKRQTVLKSLTRRASQKAQEVLRPGRTQRSSVSSLEYETIMILGTAAELQSGAEICPVTPPMEVAKVFTTSGQTSADEGLLSYGGWQQALTSALTSYNVMVEPGTYDWFAAFGPTPPPPFMPHDWQVYRMGRAETTPGGPVLIDRTGATPLIQFPFTVSGGNTGSLWTLSEGMSGARGDFGGVPIGSPFGTTGDGNMVFPAPGDRLGTDMYTLEITNLESNGNVATVSDLLWSINYLGSGPPSSGSFSLNQRVTPFVVAPVNGAPVPTWSVSGSIPSEYQGSQSWVAVAFLALSTNNYYSISATRGWLTANGFGSNYTLQGETLPGFDPLWAVTTLEDTSVSMFNTNFLTNPAAGSVFKFATRAQSN